MAGLLESVPAEPKQLQLCPTPYPFLKCILILRIGMQIYSFFFGFLTYIYDLILRPRTFIKLDRIRVKMSRVPTQVDRYVVC